jgi:hypothetical protein
MKKGSRNLDHGLLGYDAKYVALQVVTNVSEEPIISIFSTGDDVTQKTTIQKEIDFVAHYFNLGGIEFTVECKFDFTIPQRKYDFISIENF